MNDFKTELAAILEVDENELENEIFSGCALISECYGKDDAHGQIGELDFEVTNIKFDESDEDEELKHFRSLVAQGRDVDMTAYDFFISETFTIKVGDIKAECRQTFSKSVEEMFTYKKGTREIVKKDWSFSGMMSLKGYGVELID